MKKFLFLVTALALSFVGCQVDNVSEVGGGDSAPALITISLKNSRTSLGDKGADGKYPLYWSEGDKIVVNGVESEPAEISASDAATASFATKEAVSYPYHITYPYCEATAPSAPKVHFPAEQSYVEGTFSAGCAPMCAYVANAGVEVELKHLSGLLRLPLKASESGVVLDNVVITSTSGAKLSGDFAANCENATLTAASTAQNSVTYLLPSNFALSTSTEQVLYIAVPAVNVGNCTVELFDAAGSSMLLGWNGSNVKAGVVREFKAVTYVPGTTGSLVGFEEENDYLMTDENVVYGFVRNTNGEPIEGVAVSDGFTIVTTNSEGFYELTPSSDTWYIYITIPAEYEIQAGEYGQPDFYQRYSPKQHRYDFKLKPLANGKEDKFALFILGDPQVADQTGLNRLSSEAVPAIKVQAATWQAQGIPCYGITLGDLISNNNDSDRSEWRVPVRDAFHAEKAGMPVFHVMGNHDNTFFNAANPLYTDATSSNIELKAQRDHEEVYGPVNFSFNRGDMHIISMRDILYNRNDDCGAGLRRSFLKEQYQWLKQDLALVSKDKTVILCVHVQFLDGGGSYIDMTRELINEYKEAHIMSGHSHVIHSIEAAKQPNIYEHNMGALCGAWWTSYMCGDGSPSGFGVFVADGATFSDWYHIGYDKTSKYRSHQMRLYRGNAVTGASNKPNPNNKARGYYAFNFDEDVLLANVYMADEKWTVKVYEDGEYSGDMMKISVENGLISSDTYYARPKRYVDEATTPSSDGKGYGYMVGDGSYANPYCSTIPTASDIYFSGYINGCCGYSDYKVGSNASCHHLYMYKLKDKSAKVKVEAIDRFGNIYTETKITDGTDYSTVAY